MRTDDGLAPDGIDGLARPAGAGDLDPPERLRQDPRHYVEPLPREQP
jgi:hypothetical protein